MTLFDWYSGGLNVIIVALFEVCGVSWIYGTCLLHTAVQPFNYSNHEHFYA